jgi:hypothetical protein
MYYEFTVLDFLTGFPYWTHGLELLVSIRLDVMHFKYNWLLNLVKIGEINSPLATVLDDRANIFEKAQTDPLPCNAETMVQLCKLENLAVQHQWSKVCIVA